MALYAMYDIQLCVLVKKRTRKVPKGTSEYQAAWILEDGEDEDEDEEEDEAGASSFNIYLVYFLKVVLT